MLRRILATLTLLISIARAQDNFAVSGIPVSLLKNAHAVKRMEAISFHIVNSHETVLTKKWAITILDEKGEDYGNLIEYYDKLTSIKSIDGSLYDADGNRLKNLKKKDVEDLSAVESGNLADDNRKKVHRFYHNNYPYTVQYEVVIRFNQTIFFPSWMPQNAEQLSVEQSSCVVIYPPGYTVRYRPFHYNGEPVSGMGNDKKTMRWEIKNLPAIKLPFAAPLWRELTPVVYFAPTTFEIQGYKASMNTWNDLGKFQYALNTKRDVLPEAIVQKVKELTTNISSDSEKIKILYQYLQKNTRYVSIQLGLGGWQPTEAAFVAKKGYGDCKALVNYMHSLLKVAGIRSLYAIVFAGDNEEEQLMEDFPSMQFNHVILCVPSQKDTTWLECTSSSNPPGYVGAFSGDRKALLVVEDGGTLVSTPHYGIKENTQQRKIAGQINEEGELNMLVHSTYRGMQQDDLSMIIDQFSKEDVKKILQGSLELSSFDLNSFDYSTMGSEVPQLNERLELTAPAYSTLTGKRLFITPNIMNRAGSLVEPGNNKTDFVFHYSYRDVDDYEIEVPAGYEIESLPNEFSIQSMFGNYFASVKFEGNKIIYHRVMEQFAGRFAASLEADVQKFYEGVYRADRTKVVLIKNK